MKEKDADRFRRLAEDLEEASWSLNTPWRPEEPYFQSEEDAWICQEVEYRDKLDKVALQWVQDRFLPKLPAEQKYFLRLRFVAAYCFLYQFTLDDQTTVFSFPEMTNTEFLNWILTTWWHSVGSKEALFHIEESFTKRKESDKRIED